jgi:isoleucyl-tRNA synthetase
MPDYKKTLNLPKTSFPMKGNLPVKEPEILKFWDKKTIFSTLAKSRKGKPKFILHDGPPYANGDIHVGHTLNKVLKDIIVRYKNMTGYDAYFVPGWDCHGQPIEHQVEKQLGEKKKSISLVELRSRCRQYALKFVQRQKKEFQRLGIIGDWDNPYLTLDYEYEATNVSVFSKLYQEGRIYKGRKPIHWCFNCHTALAEAEIEYSPKTSPSIYIKFPLTSNFDLLSKYKQKKNLLAWTTTPWTLPANVAVAVHPEADYLAFLAEGEVYIIASKLLEAVQEVFPVELEVLVNFKGSQLNGLKTEHPLEAKESLVVNADFVDLAQGTGCVHIAPGHGVEDYLLGLTYDLPSPMPVDGSGVFTSQAGKFAGKTVMEANPLIVSELESLGKLVYAEEISHSYPHCWRCKQPVIFRATEQWFISLDKAHLREQALAAIEQVKWLPAWNIRRIKSMVSERPDWCISRQRAWGVPIPVFYCHSCGEVIADQAVLRKVEQIFRQQGADSWFKMKASEFLPAGFSCPKCGGKDFDKEKDIIDVWFESGISHQAVLKTRQELNWPADLYLEGSDQHRGWFQSSLLTSVGIENSAPYKSVLTHGFLVDGQGRKMSKSMGNVIDPLEVIKQSGADILRLWVSSSDYSTDVAISKEILSRIVEAYRRIRNTIRFALGNLNDFNFSKDRVEYQKMDKLDKWAMMRLHQLIGKVKNAYENYNFYLVYHLIYNFCNVDLSAFYFDVLKDKLYTWAANHPSRRSSQTVMANILVVLLKLIAPILVFTAEEAWLNLKDELREIDSVHLSQMPEVEESYIDVNLEQDWNRLLQLRGEVSKAIEQARNQGIIAGSLEALIRLYLPAEMESLVKDYQNDLPSIFIVSQVKIAGNLDVPSSNNVFNSQEIPSLSILVEPAKGRKCQRCWNWRESVGRDSNYPDICERCLEMLKADFT